MNPMKQDPKDRSQDATRQSILKAAAEVFSEVGYQAATTREICSRAGVNVAAVNYHFRDKLTLYTELLTSAVLTLETPDKTLIASQAPEDALRMFLLKMCEGLGNPGRPLWHVRVMMHELGNPTPGLRAVVEHVIRPNVMVLCTIVGRIIGRPPTDLRTRLCAHSIIGQVVHYIQSRPVLDLLWPEWDRSPNNFKEIANHIADFSIAALTRLAEQQQAHGKNTRRLK